MENTYSSEEYGGAFPENVIEELTEISNENENFSGDHETLNGGVPLTGATWTVAAMFAQTSGLPLKIPIESNSMDTQKEFSRDLQHWEIFWKRKVTARHF